MRLVLFDAGQLLEYQALSALLFLPAAISWPTWPPAIDMLRGRLPAAGGVRVGAKPSRQLQALWPPKCSAPPWSRAETAVGCWRRRRYSCGADLLPGLPSYTSGVRLPKRAWVRIAAEKLRVIARLVLPAGVLATQVNSISLRCHCWRRRHAGRAKRCCRLADADLSWNIRARLKSKRAGLRARSRAFPAQPAGSGGLLSSMQGWAPRLGAPPCRRHWRDRAQSPRAAQSGADLGPRTSGR